MYKFLLILFFLNFSCGKKTEDFNNVNNDKSIVVSKNQNFEKSFVGKIGNNLDVVFHLVNKNGLLNGYYFYKEKGLEIRLTGTIENNIILLSEFNFENHKSAMLECKIVENKISGNWKNLKTQKVYPLELKETNLKIPEIPTTILGNYQESMLTDCNFKLIISKKFNEYFYDIKIDNKKLTGKITFNRSLEEQKLFLTFEGIKWAEYEGELDDNVEPINKNLELPIGIQSLWQEEEIFIQNYGNSMNYYTKFSECGDKYITLQKLDKLDKKKSIFYNSDN